MQEYAILKKYAKQKIDTPERYALAILGDCATQHLATALLGTACLQKLCLNVFDADYNQIQMQIMDESSELYAFHPDAVLLVMCVEKLQADFYALAPEERPLFADQVMRQIRKYWSTLSARMPASVLQFNFAYYNDGCMGSHALKETGSFPFQIQKLNYLLSLAAAEFKNVFLVDVNGIQSMRGRNSFLDDRLYHMAKMPFSLDVLPEIAQKTVDVIEALRGHGKKAVILDLDNTLWGGVIGDDGLENIQIGELGLGHAFSDFQLWLRELKNRGILLAVCSKNEEAVAREPFEKHPDMVLRLDDFAVFIANWKDKASNIVTIQQTLNLGMDSFVFIDDNPFERNQVRGAIPDIAVPELPEDPTLYVRYLRGLNLFETAACSAADSQRTEQYRTEADRAELLSLFSTYDDYLKELDMRAVAAPFGVFQYPRIAQLTQRSNQFNLRTVRHTEAQVESLANDGSTITRYYELKDKFGDYGLISVVVLEKQPGNTLFISEWLMSCRVLKRGMEAFIVNDILSIAQKNGCRQVVGEYIPTLKNAMVADLYPRNGVPGRRQPLFCRGGKLPSKTNLHQGGNAMTREEILIALDEVFQEEFDDVSIHVTESTVASDIEDWDSLEHINLIVAVEKTVPFAVFHG